MTASGEVVKETVASIQELPRRGLLGNSEGMKRAGELERPGPPPFSSALVLDSAY